MEESEKLSKHKEHLCSNYKPILGQVITINGKPIRNPINNIKVSACIRSEEHNSTYNRCDICTMFNQK